VLENDSVFNEFLHSVISCGLTLPQLSVSG